MATNNAGYNKQSVRYFPQYPLDKSLSVEWQSRPILFDRIINVRLFRAAIDPVTNLSSEALSEKDAVTIRSDYELIFTEYMSDRETQNTSGIVRFAKCKQKPSIKLSATFYKGGVSPKLTLSIDNFSIDTSDGTLYALDKAHRPFVYAEIHMGYINQFFDWPASGLTGTEAFTAFRALKNDSSSVTVIKGSILNCQITKQPPDSRTEFEIIPASISAGVPDVRTFFPPYESLAPSEFVQDLYKSAVTYKDYYTGVKTRAEEFAQDVVSNGVPTFTQNLFYYLISRRFYSTEYNAGADALDRAERLRLYYTTVGQTTNPSFDDLNVLRKYLARSPSEADQLLFLPKDSAKAEGYMRTVVGTRSMMFAIPGEIAELLSEDAPVSAITNAIASYAEIWDITPVAVLNDIKSRLFPTLSFSVQTIRSVRAAPRVSDMGIHAQSDTSVPEESCVYIYDGNSSDDAASTFAPDIANASGLQAVLESESRTMFIPCINSLTYGAVSKAIMPFCGTFPISVPVRFDSAYTLADDIAYYAPNRKGTGVFLAYQMDIEFATVDDDNTVTLTMDTTTEVFS